MLMLLNSNSSAATADASAATSDAGVSLATADKHAATQALVTAGAVALHV